jgi:HD-like signal output (HDOD) protein
MGNTSVKKCAVEPARILKVAAGLGLLGSSAQRGPAIMAALCDPKTTPGQLAALIESEAALYARVLRVANSSYYGQSRTISTVARALVLLGFDAVRGIAAAACLQRSLPRSHEPPLIDTRALMTHSIATAAAAELLARTARPARAADAFITGLLHNLGTVVQIQVDVAGVMAMLDRRMQGDTRGIAILESEYASVSHELCVALIYESWNLPDAVIAATGHHHSPQSAPAEHRDLTYLINLGASLALAAGCTFALEPQPVADDTEAMAALGIPAQRLAEVTALLPAQVSLLTSELLDG